MTLDMLLYVAIFLQILDFFSTWLALRHGYNREANPIVRRMIKKWGLVLGLLICKAFAVGVLFLFGKGVSPILLVLVIAAYAYTIHRNISIAIETRW